MIVIDSNIDQSRAISSCEVSQTLERVLGSKIFLRSRRLSQFLRFAVEQALAGRQDQLKEYTIGTLVYGRTPDFDPSQDSIVRAEARSIRQKKEKMKICELSSVLEATFLPIDAKSPQALLRPLPPFRLMT